MKKIDVQEIIKRHIEREGLFEPSHKILAAVSGGADSLCLLLVLQQLDYPLHIAHFDHGLRADSARDAETVRRAAERLGVPFSIGRGNVREHAKKNRLTLEEAARDLRYEFLYRTAIDSDAAVIATGHTMNDQAETVLMHLLRGTGLRGLGGIRPISNPPGHKKDPARRRIKIARPLLCVTHAQTMEYCRQAGWIPTEDPSNQDLAFTRNRIRRTLLPALEEYNPSIVEGLSRLADIAQDQNDFLEAAIGALWNQSVQRMESGGIRISLQAMKNAPAAIQQELVHRAILEVIGETSDLAYRHIIRVMEFVLHPTASRRMDLALGVDVALENDWLTFYSKAGVGSEPSWESIVLDFPGSLNIVHPDWTIDLTLLEPPHPSSIDDPQIPWEVWIDLDCVRLPFSLRKRKRGDRFFPSGMPRPVRLSDFMASHHLPFSERDQWPLVCDADGIIWIPGFRTKEGIALSKKTVRCARIHVRKLT